MKKTIIYIIIIFSIFIITGCNKNVQNNNINNNEEVNSLKIIIEEKEYLINLENNKTVKELIKMLPIELEMNDLNGNEKYTYLDKDLSSTPYNPNHITKGDIMLYGKDCLVIFYESFDTTYSYTKIGHIDNLLNLGNSNINIIIKKV